MPMIAVVPGWLVRRSGEKRAAETLNRLGKSQHVADLRLITWATVYVSGIGSLLAIIFSYWHTVSDNWKVVAGASSAWPWIRLFGDSLFAVSSLIGPVIALACGVTAWAYQSGSARIGIVDLFACEIGTICRVFAITDVARRYVEAFNIDLHGPPDQQMVERIRHAFSHFDSTEDYTPVFDHNAADLRVLEVRVVTNVTAFYTYFKAMRDTLRIMTRIDAPLTGGHPHDPWHEALKSVVYMMFLTLESARKAIRDLIEFDPNQVESIINVLINELTAYHFLMIQFGLQSEAAGQDFRYARLCLRLQSYREIVGDVYWRAMDGKQYFYERSKSRSGSAQLLSDNPERSCGPGDFELEMARQWAKAAETAHELEKRYQLVFPRESIQRPTGLPSPGKAGASGSLIL